MRIVGLEGLSDDQFRQELANGGRFVIFKYCVSLLVITLQRPSAVHFIRGGEGTLARSLPYTLMTLLLGWWGIPWGPIYSLGSLFTNLGGGKDVTASILNAMQQQAAPQEGAAHQGAHA